LAKWADETIVYVDEAGMDNREDYSYGWNERGQRFHALKSGRRQGRVNMIAALCLGQLMAPFTIEGSCNRSVARDLVGNLLNSCAQTWAGSGHG
jgi:hypothetical protein